LKILHTSLFLKIALCAIFILPVTGIISFSLHKQANASLAESVEIWWPSEGAYLSGSVPFKGMLQSKSVDEYTMYWRVDDGDLVKMDSNFQDYPHKEAMVDLSGWHWKGASPYKISFVAKGSQGEIIGEKSVNVYVNASKEKAESEVAQPVSLPDPIKESNSPASSIPRNIEVWWPTNNSVLSGPTPLKGIVQGLNISEYDLFWQLDGGAKDKMEDSYAEYPHKEILTDVSFWPSNTNSSHNIIFTAYSNNVEIASTTVRVLRSASKKFFVDQNSNAKTQANEWSVSRQGDASLMQILAAEPTARWFGGWNYDVKNDVKKLADRALAAGEIPIIVAYNIPHRDCGSYSAGGASSAAGYLSWIRNLKEGIGNNDAVVIVEPDALAGMDCLPVAGQDERLNMLAQAVSILKENPKFAVYIDAGNPHWIADDVMADRLTKAGIAQADGFSLNVSNFHPISENISYGERVSKRTAGKHFVIDTSRNGNGSNGEWCNPQGRKIGVKPTSVTGNDLVDAFLWIKTPGESDGSCNGGPSAGAWWPEYALGLVK
jgi:endoglucanase